MSPGSGHRRRSVARTAADRRNRAASRPPARPYRARAHPRGISRAEAPHGMGELMLDQIRAHPQHLIQYRARHRPEAVPAHFVLGDAQPAHCSQDGVITHGAIFGARARKNKATITCDGLHLTQNGDGLVSERDYVGIAFFGCDIAPFRRIQINVRPFGLAQLHGAHEYQRRELQSAAHDQLTPVGIDCSEQFRRFSRLSYRRHVLYRRRA